MSFDARRIPLKIIAGSKSGDDKAVALCFYPETKDESDRLYAALMRMRETGRFEIEASPVKPQRAAADAARGQPAPDTPPPGAGPAQGARNG